MIMHQWTPASPIPTSPMESEKFTKQRLYLRWLKIFISATILIIFITFSILYLHQEKKFFDKFHFDQEFYRREDRLHHSLDRYFDDISNALLKPADPKINDFIRSKTLVVLRSIDKNQKADVLRFLYEQNLLQTDQIDLSGADFRHVELNCLTDLRKIHLAGIIWSNGIVRNCRFDSSNFNGAIFSATHFFNSTFYFSTLVETKFDKTIFEGSTLFKSSFYAASFIQSDLIRMNIVQGNNFTRVDFYRAKLTNDQLQGKYHSIIPHDFQHARFPNGSFDMIDENKNLLINGDAETECELGTATPWLSIPTDQNIVTDFINGNFSGTSDSWANCSFVVNTNVRIYQSIDLRKYSLMIDTENAIMKFSGETTCEKPFFHLEFIRFDGIVQQTKFVSTGIFCRPFDENQTIFCYAGESWSLASGIRTVRLEFGVESSESISSCFFDQIVLSLSSK